jgi:hypothetical protein
MYGIKESSGTESPATAVDILHVTGVSASAQAVVSTLHDCCGQLVPHDEMRSHANRTAVCDRSDWAAQVLR